MQVFTSNQLDKIIELDEDLAKEIIESFFEVLPQNIEKLNLALDECDFEKVNFIAHSLKNDSANVGGVQLHSLCEQLEKKCKESDLNSCTALVNDIQQSKLALITELNNYLVSIQ
jgi:HPt (histidine-containing phosphotransfer) domain-containing protein